MALQFYYGSGSPYAWRVWLALEHKRIPYALKVLSFSAGDLQKPEYLAINPRHRVPAIVDDGFALYESAAILEYLDERYPEQPLFPGDVRQRALIRRLVREADQYFATALEGLVEQILFTPEQQWSEPDIDKARDGIVAELAFWEQHLNGEWLGPQLSAADFTLYPLVALAMRIATRKTGLNLRDAVGTKLADWMRRVEGLAYFKRTWPPHWDTA